MQSRVAKRPKKSTADESKAKTETRWKHPMLYIFSLIILIIIVVTFVGGPLLSGLGSRSTIVFGSWGGRDITFVPGNYLSQQRDILYDQLRDSGTSDSFEFQAYSVWKGAYDRTVVRSAILEISERSAVHVSDDLIDQSLLISGPYMENGVFSEERYRNTSNADRFQYRSLVKDDLIHSRFLEDLSNDSISSESAADFLRNMAVEERSFEFVVFGYDEYPESEVADFAKENAELFRRVNLSRITVRSSLDELETIRSQIVDGIATFEDQARNYSVDGFADKGGDMGWREYQALRTDFVDLSDLDALFSLKQGDLSESVETDFGFVFYRVDEAPLDADLENSETVASIRSYLNRFERGRIEDYLLAQAENFSSSAGGSGSGFASEAARRGVVVQQTNSFPINYGGAFFLKQPSIEGEAENTLLQTAVYNERFFTVLFSLESETISEPIVLDDAIAVFRLNEITRIEAEELEYLVSYYGYIQQQYLDQGVSDFILSSDEFEDNFTPVFTELFL